MNDISFLLSDDATGTARARKQKPLCVFFGDSICFGYGVRREERWINLLEQKMLHWRFVNAGCCGDTTIDALKRMENDVERRKPDILYVQFGLNDCSAWQSGDKTLVSPETYSNNMFQLVSRGLRCGAQRVILASNHALCEGRSALAGFGDQQHLRYAKKYNALLRELFCRCDASVAFLDLENTLPAAALADDGVHLSSFGNACYAQTIYRYLKNIELSIKL